jgi:hypothetical protein
MIKQLFKPVDNPLIKDTLRRRFHAAICRRYGHITSGPYYGMMQSHCRRCGVINKGIAADFCKDWDEPWGEYL